jgi:Na+-driven multidrug efflux pump
VEPGPDLAVHVLSVVALGSLFVGLILLCVAVGAGYGAARTITAVSSLCLMAVGVLIVLGLIHAQQPICHALGGGWYPESASCRDEWGGNGNNDASNGISF